MMALLAQLTLEDLEETESRQKGKQRDDAPLSDAELALRFFVEDAQATLSFQRDRALALSLQGDVDVPNVGGFQARQAPPVVRPPPPPLPPRRANATAPTLAPNETTTGAASWGSWFYGIVASLGFNLEEQAKSSQPSQSQSQLAPSSSRGQNCVACQDPIRGTALRAPCGHHYDIDCIKDLFEASTRDESLYPPRCCRASIPLTLVRSRLGEPLLRRFEEKGAEFGTQRRVYCGQQTCSRFLGPQEVVHTGWFATKVKPSVLVCTAPPGCGARTCSGCKVLVTANTHLCTDDASDRALLALGAQQGWSRCPGCSRMIELNLGCYHMTCLCKTEFCYLCRARWKTCACPQWDERRLYAAAEARVDGQRPDVRRVPAPRAAAVATNPVRAPVQEERRVRQVDPPRPAVAAPRRPANANANTGENRLSQANLRLLEARTAQESRDRVERERVLAAETARRVEAEQRRVQLVREAERARLVREAMEDLRENHECAHTKWKYRRGGGKCQTCFHNLPNYLFRCTGCQILACNRCRRNRL